MTKFKRIKELDKLSPKVRRNYSPFLLEDDYSFNFIEYPNCCGISVFHNLPFDPDFENNTEDWQLLACAALIAHYSTGETVCIQVVLNLNQQEVLEFLVFLGFVLTDVFPNPVHDNNPLFLLTLDFNNFNVSFVERLYDYYLQ